MYGIKISDALAPAGIYGQILAFAGKGETQQHKKRGNRMELILARQSVIIKCSIQASVMMGNYEFYYAGGLLCALAGKMPDTKLRPQEFYEFLQPLLDAYEPKDEREAYLAALLKGYKVLEEYDAQMEELMQMGLEEKNIWVRTPSQ